MTQPQAAPVPYATVHPNDDNYRAVLLRLSTASIGAWGTRVRSADVPDQTYIMMTWGFAIDVTETLAQIDALMGYTGP